MLHVCDLLSSMIMEKTTMRIMPRLSFAVGATTGTGSLSSV